MPARVARGVPSTAVPRQAGPSARQREPRKHPGHQHRGLASQPCRLSLHLNLGLRKTQQNSRSRKSGGRLRPTRPEAGHPATALPKRNNRQTPPVFLNRKSFPNRIHETIVCRVAVRRWGPDASGAILRVAECSRQTVPVRAGGDNSGGQHVLAVRSLCVDHRSLDDRRPKRLCGRRCAARAKLILRPIAGQPVFAISSREPADCGPESVCGR